jgi:hypothetical protein
MRLMRQTGNAKQRAAKPERTVGSVGRALDLRLRRLQRGAQVPALALDGVPLRPQARLALPGRADALLPRRPVGGGLVPQLPDLLGLGGQLGGEVGGAGLEVGDVGGGLGVGGALVVRLRWEVRGVLHQRC